MYIKHKEKGSIFQQHRNLNIRQEVLVSIYKDIYYLIYLCSGFLNDIFLSPLYQKDYNLVKKCFNSSPRIKQTLRWFLQTFTSRFIELSSRYRLVTLAYSSNYQCKSLRITFRRIN